jgi:hypothetical protein
VRLIKMLGLAVTAAIAVMALSGASSAMAESTALCKEDAVLLTGEACPSGKLISTVEETTLPGHKAVLKTSIKTVECTTLFTGTVQNPTLLGTPLEISGGFVYEECSTGCTVTELNGPATILVLKLGHELADVTGEGEVLVACSGLHCVYNGENLAGHGLGPLLSTETNGDVTLTEQETHKVSGTFCPSTSKLTIKTTPKTAPAYISK